MRDFKNVKVPRKYRNTKLRVSVKRADTGGGGRKRQSTGGRNPLLGLLWIALLSGGIWGAWQAYRAVTHAEMFQVSGVDIKGVRTLSEGDLKNIAGEFTGQNIFRADLEAAVRRAHANTWIKDVRIHRSLPNRISMVVEERTPYAVLEANGGRYLVDNEGVVIDRLAKTDKQPLPTIAARDERPQPGEQLGSEAVGEAMTLLSEIESRGGWNPADITLKADSTESLSVVYADREFRIGSGRYAEKLRRLAEIMSDVKARNLNIAYVDVRPESQAAVMLKTSGSAGKTPANKHQPAKKRRR